MSRGIGVIDHESQFILPTASETEGIELMLLEDVGGEPIGVGSRPPFGIGQEINFAMSLLEGLNHFMLLEPFSPLENLLGGMADGMPEGNRCVLFQGEGFAIGMDELTIEPDAIEVLPPARPRLTAMAMRVYSKPAATSPSLRRGASVGQPPSGSLRGRGSFLPKSAAR